MTTSYVYALIYAIVWSSMSHTRVIVSKQMTNIHVARQFDLDSGLYFEDADCHWTTRCSHQTKLNSLSVGLSGNWARANFTFRYIVIFKRLAPLQKKSWNFLRRRTYIKLCTLQCIWEVQSVASKPKSRRVSVTVNSYWFSLKLVPVRYDCCLVVSVFSVHGYGIVTDSLFDIYTEAAGKKCNFVFPEAVINSNGLKPHSHLGKAKVKTISLIYLQTNNKKSLLKMSNYSVERLLNCLLRSDSYRHRFKNRSSFSENLPYNLMFIQNH